LLRGPATTVRVVMNFYPPSTLILAAGDHNLCWVALFDRRSAWRSSRIAQAAAQSGKHRHAPDVMPDVEDDLSRLVDHEGRTMHQLLQHCA